MKRLVFLVFAAAAYAQSPAPMHLTLAEAEQMALNANPQIKQAGYQARASEEVTREFRSRYMPTFEANVTAVGADDGSRLAAGALNNPIVYSRLGTGVTLSQVVTDFGRTRNLVGSAKQAAQAQQEAVHGSRADIVLQTDAAYFAVLRSRAVLTVAHETVNTRQVSVDQVDQLFRSKLKSEADLRFANVNLAEAKLALATAENDVKASEAELARLLALPSSTEFETVDPKLDGAAPPAEQSVIGSALMQRPDLLQMRLELQSLESTVKAEADLSRPNVSALASAGYVPAANAVVPGTYGAVGLNLEIPIFNGGLYRARRFEASARSAAAQEAVRGLELQIRRDVRVSWLNATNAFSKLALTQDLFEQARVALELAQSRYRLGLSSIVELSQSQLQYTSAEIAHTRAVYDYDAEQSILKYQAGQIR